MEITCYTSPVGIIEIRSENEKITGLCFCTRSSTVNKTSPALESCIAQLDEYFAGKRRTFDLPLEQTGTAFQREVWNALSEIPYGTTVSYADIARKIGKPHSFRAVGYACGKNHLWLVVPCHRVIGSDGSLTGYAGGTDRKKWLLEHEAKFFNDLPA
ncbi:MAG: methylated-DNA--[protein]-cysteine S-methyltransferase [Bacteroidales bacterium]|jgi:methylated-DNA-[protein]-cysteine S-methyltransferase|nr:methylated-DNA--[protein]-cysteine S-methyltransferase [Bacteroidales bacterium]